MSVYGRRCLSCFTFSLLFPLLLPAALYQGRRKSCFYSLKRGGEATELALRALLLRPSHHIRLRKGLSHQLGYFQAVLIMPRSASRVSFAVVEVDHRCATFLSDAVLHFKSCVDRLRCNLQQMIMLSLCCRYNLYCLYYTFLSIIVYFRTLLFSPFALRNASCRRQRQYQSRACGAL